MSPLLRVLMLVDTVAESDILARELRRTGFELLVRRATTEAAYLAELESPLDLILADNALPELATMRALQILRTSELDIPLIVITESAGEAAAIECVSLGAVDYLFKDQPARLATAAVRALDQRELREYAREADAALHKSAAINQSVLDALPVHIAMLNVDGVIVAVNRAWEHFARTNGDPDLLATCVGRNYLDACRMATGENGAEAQQVLHGIIAVLAGTLDQFTIEYPCHSPIEERWFTMSVTPLAGEHTGAVVAHENITARTRVQMALRESEDRFRTTFEQAAVGIAHLALSGQFLRVNNRLCDIIGYACADLLARTVHDLSAPDLVLLAQAGARQLLARHLPSFSTEISFIRKDSLLVWISMNVSLVYDAQGAPSYFIALVEDITERRKADATRALLAAIVEASDDAIIGLATDGTVISWNAGAEHLYGYHADQMLGRPIAMLRSPHLHDEMRPFYDRLARGERIAQFETVRLCNDGQQIDVALTISAIRDASGVVSGFSTISRDISERMRGERTLGQKTAFISLFQEVAVAANQATSLNQALQTTIDKICMHIGWPVGHVYLPDPDMSGALLPTDIWHLEDVQRFTTFRKITEVVRLAPGIGLPGQVMATRKPAWISDMILDVSTPRTRLIQDIGVRAGFALPVLLGDEVAAVLEFFATDVIAPDQALLDILQHVATQLGRVVERARSEAALRESEQRFRVLFEHSPDAILLIDPHHPDVAWPIVECNGVACRMNGYTRDEMIGQSIDLLNSGVGQPAERAIYVERLRREGTIQFEDFHRRKDGSFFSIEILSSLISIDGRELVLGIDRDISQRKHAEEALRMAEAQYRTLVEQSPAIIYTAAIDELSSTYYISPQVETILGFSPDEWLSDPHFWLKQVHPDDRALVLDAVQRSQSSEAAIPVEYRSYTRAGDIVWLLDASQIVRDPAGQPLFMQGIMQDITERRRSEDALARYQLLSEHARDIILFLRSDGRIIEANQAALVAYGYTRDELLAQRIYALRSPDSQLEVDVRMAQVDNVGILYEAIHRRKDGQLFSVEVGSRSAVIGGERVIVSIIRDITARKRTEDALRNSERLYRTLAANFPNGAVLLFDHNLRFTIADGAGLAAVGMAREAMEGRTLWEVYPPELSAEYASYYRDALVGISNVRETSTDDHTYVVHTLPVRDESGEIIAGMLMSQDITDRKRMEAALIEERSLLARRVDERTADLSAANAELARTAVLKDEFLASMSHELRTPLNAVLGLSEALQEEVYGPVNDRQRRSLFNIEESGRHLLELINDILDLAKIGAGKMDLVLEPSSIETICQASLRLIKQIAQQKRLLVDLKLDPSVALLNVDARRVKQILVNLLSNAVKFTPEGGAIGLEVVGDAARQAVELTVWDTGIGIAHEQMTQLFQPFVQLDSRLARQYEGTGLGLALVYRMVELHGGSISVTSEVERGSRFTVALPWHAADVGAQVSQPVASDLVAINRFTVRRALICEDSPTTADQITRYLHELEIESLTVRDGEQVVALAIAERPELIILDLLLPDISGWDVLARLKADPRTRAIPVLIISVLDERTRGLALGAAEYLVKPVMYTDLQRVLSIVAPAPSGDIRPQASSVTDITARAAALPMVLLAEDNEANITMIADYLGTRGYQVVVARNGAEAIARAREARPAIVLMDIQMPGMDGLEATRRIRSIADLVDLPIIALTALAMPGDRERCLAAGANDYLSKPVSLRGLATLIENYLRQHPSQ